MTNPIDYLSIDDILEVVSGIIPDARVRDVGLLESAVSRPQTFVFGVETYRAFPEKVAALMHAIARNHALVDGNKRLAWAAGRIFCLLNGCDIRLDVDAAEDLILGLATGALDVHGTAVILETCIVEDAS